MNAALSGAVLTQACFVSTPPGEDFVCLHFGFIQVGLAEIKM